MKSIFIIFIFLILSVNVNAKPMSMVDLLNVPSVQNVQLSPDGKALVFVKSVANWEENINIQTLWRVNIDSQSLQQISSNIASAINPRWAPDGTHLLFLSKRHNDKNVRIYILPLKGGEAMPLTDHETSISAAEWSKDGQEIFFIAADPIDKNQEKRKQEKDDIYQFEFDYQQKHLWKYSLKDNISRKLTQGDYSITDFRLSPDGKKLFITKLKAHYLMTH